MNREILRLAIPNILSNVSVPLISSFDTALMGSLGGAHIAAVGLGSMAFNFVYWNFGFLRMGTTGLTAQAYGKESTADQAQALLRGALLALSIGLLLVLLQSPLIRFTEWLLNIRPDQLALVEDYFFIRIIAAPAALLQMVLLGWFFGRQNAIWPLLLTLAVNSCNLALSYYLVAVRGWGIAGVAWGTVAAQYFGLALGVGLLAYGKWREPAFPLSRKLLSLRSGAVSLGAFFRINRDIFIRTICLTLSFAFFYNRANALDAATATVAANVILLQLVNWLSYGVDGFAFAAESLVGKYAGADRRRELSRVIRLIFAWGMGLAGIYALIYGIGGSRLLALFAPEASAADTLTVTLRYLPVLIAFCLLATPCYLMDGIFVGLTASTAMRQTMLLAFAGYLIAYYLVGRHFGNWGLWGSLLLFMVLRAGMQGLWWRLGWVKSVAGSG
ncbi:MATE family multidrug resistance protein [Neolewinella xylanilytica]|uniref:MATE family multidrug resistance protein n=1 Tax=Neolewinella xylanilytica TaxID=1514080 RepID=A0A2S6I6V2_9BACT|nr:MATE family efflux transporter [Neolewinella xylanilytica]PPK87224.1 MATE family multidrug resistance protein [Neolewinella xylanilytica]